MRLVGILLISALIVLPNITGMLFGKGFKQTVTASISISVFSVIFGIILSYYFDLAPSGIIVMISVAILVVALAAKYFGIIGKSMPIQKAV